MSRISNDKREIFLRLYKQDKKAVEISEIIGVTRRTIDYWINLVKQEGETRLFKIFKTVGVLKIDLDELRKTFETNKFAFNREIAEQFHCSDSTIERYRHLLGYTNKTARITYKESRLELKKTLKNN